MTKFTKEQQLAIDLEHTNILVSAGAGSGKTAVLTERVLRKIKEGTSISRLLILTFTKAAAGEMKERIRKALVKDQLQEALQDLDNSYITTFDSFALSVVQKYHVELGLSKEIAITEEAILELEKERILEEIFEEQYEKEDPMFIELLSSFALKDDKILKQYILSLEDAFNQLLDKNECYQTYEEVYYNTSYLKKLEEEYFNLILKEKERLHELVMELCAVTEGKFQEKLLLVVTPLLDATTYDEMKNHLEFRLPSLPKNSEMDAKAIKKKLSETLKKFKEYFHYEDDEEIQKELLSTKQNTLTLLKLTKTLDERYSKYKQEENLFTFMDIARLAIKAVSTYPEIQEELKNSFDEIMVDEYQDTNDLQEAFLSYISNHNIYMVGDMKQSIYRFRHANPKIFKEKYEQYKQGQDGVAIDLSKNFRSREEVLSDINLLFSNLMNDTFGGVTYQDGHAMVFGNVSYLKEKEEKDYSLEVLTYKMQDDDNYKEYEKEIFLIASDIQQKIKENYQVFDKDTQTLRPISYADFAILLDRSKYFDIYKRIFEYLGIPLRILKDEKITNEIDLVLLKNMLLLAKSIHEKNYSTTFRHAYVSLARSFLYEMNDSTIYKTLLTNTFYETQLFQDFQWLSTLYDTTTPSVLLLELLNVTHYEERLIRRGKVSSYRKRMEYFYHLATSLEKIGKTNDDFLNLLENIIETGLDIGISYEEEGENAVSLMTIHKSKGLEFPICYFADFNHSYNMQELKEKVKFNREYGIILPSMSKEEETKTICSVLLKAKVEEEEISEKIRLFYVALTRAREKMIVVCPKLDEDACVKANLSDDDRRQALSFYKMFSLLSFYWKDKEKEVSEIPNLSKDYLKPLSLSDIDLEEDEPIIFVEEEPMKAEEKERFSKTMVEPLTLEEEENIELGLKIHSILERIDFEHPDYDSLDVENDIKESVKAFVESDFLKEHKHSKIYREYEFLEEISHTMYHGIIDLLILEKDKAIIVDYKLKNTQDDAYKKQLLGYKSVIEKRTGLPVKTYLYSILDKKIQNTRNL